MARVVELAVALALAVLVSALKSQGELRERSAGQLGGAEGRQGEAKQAHALVDRQQRRDQAQANLLQPRPVRDRLGQRPASGDLAEVGVLDLQRHRATANARPLAPAPDLVDQKLELGLHLLEAE